MEYLVNSLEEIKMSWNYDIEARFSRPKGTFKLMVNIGHAETNTNRSELSEYILHNGG